MLVRRAGALPPLALHINPVRSRETDSRMWPVAALVLVVDPAGKVGIDPDVAAASLGLTPMEGQVAVLLAGGMNVREIAAATRRRESTIRSHVKHIFAKHGLSRLALALLVAAQHQRAVRRLQVQADHVPELPVEVLVVGQLERPRHMRLDVVGAPQPPSTRPSPPPCCAPTSGPGSAADASRRR